MKTRSVSRATTSGTSRANPQTWRLAKWLHDQCAEYGPYTRPTIETVGEVQQNRFYDKAKELTYAFMYNAFTGPDNHGD